MNGQRCPGRRHKPLTEWTFSIRRAGDTLKAWTWQEFPALPIQTVTVDIHCVTRWSKLDTVWRGVSDTLLDQVEHDLMPELDGNAIGACCSKCSERR